MALLALVDIDGTLLLGPPRAHVAAMLEAIEEVYGVRPTGDDLARVRPAGRTDQEIAALVLARAGVPPPVVRRGLAAWMRATAARYPSCEAAHSPPAVAPGAREALALLRDAGVRLALVTGNLEPIARAKMRQAGLADLFPRGGGGFGSDDMRRPALVRIALARAGGDRPWPAERAVVVGDTPSDVACAHANDVRAVAVATGPVPRAALGDADAVVDDLRGAAAVVTAWMRAPA